MIFQKGEVVISWCFLVRLKMQNCPPLSKEVRANSIQRLLQVVMVVKEEEVRQHLPGSPFTPAPRGMRDADGDDDNLADDRCVHRW